MFSTAPKLSPPVVVAVSEPGETRWGFTQFPALTLLPDGQILLTYADAEDRSETHGGPALALVSGDGGLTWTPHTGEPEPRRPHFSITPAANGEFLTIPSIAYLDTCAAGVSLPNPIATANVYGEFYTYRASDFPDEVRRHFQYLEAQRWSPSNGRWKDETVEYDTRDLLVWRREGSDLLPRTFFERPALPHRGELHYPDYRVRYLLEDGRTPAKGGTTLMVSSDNGKTFRRRTTIAADPSGRDLYGEPVLAETSNGGLVCVIRKTDHQQKPMSITWSGDGGHTWEAPRDFCEFGVFPCLLKLDSGPLVLSYGRPGVYLRINADGRGRDWSDPIPLIAGDRESHQKHSCGYTNMIALDETRLLLAYSDFQHRDSQGRRRKAILTRQIQIS